SARHKRAWEQRMLTAVKYEAGRAPILAAPGPRKGFAHAGVTWPFLLLGLLLGLVGSVPAAASSPPQIHSAPALASTSSFTLADFDGDRKPDLASVEFNRFDSSSVRYWITLRLTTGGGQTVEVIGPLGGLDISARDVNGDAALDLIVRTAWQHRIVAIFLNDGHGHFAAADPSALSSAMENSSAAWLPAARQSREDSALSRSEYSAGDCEGVGALSRPQEFRHSAFSPEFKLSRFFFSSSFGRAPPASVSLV